MAGINRSVIAKAVFSISVVAVTAGVGVVGFAQAQSRTVRPSLNNGYGGIGAQVQAAAAAFQAALADAASMFQSDVQKCVSDFVPGSVSATSTLSDTSAATEDFSAATANPTALHNTSDFDSHFASANASLQGRVAADSATLIANVARNAAISQSQRDQFRACMASARSDFRSALDDARQAFRDALNDIFGR